MGGTWQKTGAPAPDWDRNRPNSRSVRRQVARLVSAFTEVNHNYQREHAWNLWFVVTAPDQQRVERVLADIESATGLTVLNLPLERAFYIDLGFPLWC